jgi:hypothetical protein
MKPWKLLPLLTAFALVVAAQANAQEADVEGAFDSLSTGNRKIANVLFDAHVGAGGPLSRDDIAAMKQDGTGWGRLFQDLQANGDIPPDVKNLGELVSGRYQATSEVTTASGSEPGSTESTATESGTTTKGGSAPGSAASGRGKGTIVVTTAGGGQIVVQRGNRRGQGTGADAKTTGKTTGGGVGHGHGEGGGRSITVTTAGGGSVSAGGGKANGLGHGKGGVTVSTAGGGSLGSGQGHGVKVGGGGQGHGTGPKQ